MTPARRTALREPSAGPPAFRSWGFALVLASGLVSGCLSEEGLSSRGSAESDLDSGPAAVEGRPEPRPFCCLGAGDVAHGTLAPAARVRYGVRLAPGELLEVVAHQDHADLALRVTDPGGRLLLRLDSPVGRREPERLLFVAEEAGVHGLEVEGVPASPEGAFRLEVVGLGPASPQGAERAAAAVAVARAHELRRRDRLEEAAVAYRRGAGHWGALGEPARSADAHRWAGRVLTRLGRLESAAASFGAAARAFRQAGDPAARAGALADRGEFLRDAGRLDAADAALEQALALQRRHRLIASQARTTTLLANVLKVRNELAAAALRYEEALALWRRLERPRDRAVTLANLAGVYNLAGQPDLALDFLEEARALLPDGAGSADRAFLLGEMGLTYRRLGRIEEARVAYRDALEHHRRSEAPGGAVVALEGLGRLHYEAGEYAEARRRYREALAASGAGGDPLRRATLVQSLGWVELRRGEPLRALPRFRRALAAFRRAGFAVGEAATLGGIARVERATGHLAAAEAWARRALDALEEVRSAAQRPDLQASLLATRQDTFDFAVDTLMELHRQNPGEGYDARAFAVSERARARRLLDLLPGTARSHAAGAPERVEPSAAVALRERVNAAEEERLRLLGAGAGRDALDGAERTLRRALDELRRATAFGGVGAGEGAADQGVGPRPPDTLTLEEIQESLLPSGTLFLSYDLGEERSYLWAVAPGWTASYALPPAGEIEGDARRLHHLLSNSHRRGTSRQVELQAARFAGTVLGAVASRLEEFRRIVVSAEGDLHLIPFGALPAPGGDGEPLLATQEVVAVPSASAWARMRRGREKPAPRGDASAGRLLAVVADPVFGPEDERLASGPEATPEAEPTPAAGRPENAAQPGDRATRLGRLPLYRLPYSSQEAEAVLARVAPSRRTLLEGFGARKDRILRGELADFRILHFATHGLASSEQPELSALVLSRFDRQGRPRDGFLWAHEIAGLPLSAELAVLSACDTARGAPLRGEGLVGLAHAFFQAGVPRVVVSLWPVDDEGAVELMARFYAGYLDEGFPAPEALHRAQLAVREEPRWQRPYFWAGFVVQGAP